MKYAIWKTETEKTGISPEAPELLSQLHAASEQTVYGRAPSLEMLLGPCSPILRTVARLNTKLRGEGWRWTELRPPDQAQARLAEILDIRFGLLGEAGIFETLDRQGVLSHRMVTEAEIANAMREAPKGTRAHARSLATRELAGREGAWAWWTYVTDTERGTLDLSRPLGETATWQPPAGSHAPPDSLDGIQPLEEGALW